MDGPRRRRRSIRYNADGIRVAADVNIVTGGEGQRTPQHVTTRQRIVQRDGKTVVSESRRPRPRVETGTGRLPVADVALTRSGGNRGSADFVSTGQRAFIRAGGVTYALGGHASTDSAARPRAREPGGVSTPSIWTSRWRPHTALSASGRRGALVPRQSSRAAPTRASAPRDEHESVPEGRRAAARSGVVEALQPPLHGGR